jgi:hypothetical protein
MNKKAQLGEQIMIFVFIFFLVIIGGGIVIGTVLFLGNDIDFRETGATILAYQIKQCIIDGKTSTIVQGDNEQMLSALADKCGLRKDVIGVYNRIKICLNSRVCIQENEKSRIFVASDGDFNMCDKTFASKNQGLSKCVSDSFNSGNNFVTILVTDKQAIRRVSK